MRKMQRIDLIYFAVAFHSSVCSLFLFFLRQFHVHFSLPSALPKLPFSLLILLVTQFAMLFSLLLSPSHSLDIVDETNNTFQCQHGFKFVLSFKILFFLLLLISSTPLSSSMLSFGTISPFFHFFSCCCYC